MVPLWRHCVWWSRENEVIIWHIYYSSFVSKGLSNSLLWKQLSTKPFHSTWSRGPMLHLNCDTHVKCRICWIITRVYQDCSLYLAQLGISFPKQWIICCNRKAICLPRTTDWYRTAKRVKRRCCHIFCWSKNFAIPSLRNVYIWKRSISWIPWLQLDVRSTYGNSAFVTPRDLQELP